MLSTEKGATAKAAAAAGELPIEAREVGPRADTLGSMPSFEYTAVAAGGERTQGEIAGASKQAVLAELAARRLTAVTVEPVVVGAGLGAALARLRTVMAGSGGVSTRSLATAYGQTADLLRAGVPLLRALSLIGNMKSSPRLAAAFRQLAELVAAGTDLAEAMKQQPRIFKSVHVAMVRAGERGGFLEPVLARLARLLMGQADMRSKVIGNLIYPALLVGFGTVIMGVIFGVFIPMFKPVYERMPELGSLTRVVLWSSGVARALGLPLLILSPALLFGVITIIRAPRLRAWWGRAHLRLPIIGNLSRSIAAARFCRVLGAMLSNGVPVLTALAIAKDAAGSIVREEAIAGAAEAVRQGERLAEPLDRSGLFGEDVIEMIRVGEQANSLGEVLGTIADTLESRVDRLLTAAVRLIEPLMLVVLAVVIGLVAMALILPMTRISQAV